MLAYHERSRPSKLSVKMCAGFGRGCGCRVETGARHGRDPGDEISGGAGCRGILNEKAKVGIQLLDGMLSDFEAQASKLRERGLADAAGSLMDEGRRVVDESLAHARRWSTAGSAEPSGLPRPWRSMSSGPCKAPSLVFFITTNSRSLGGLTLISYAAIAFSETKLDCVRSAFGFSNELVNIWSHGLGLVLVLAVAFYFYPTSLNFFHQAPRLTSSSPPCFSSPPANAWSAAPYGTDELGGKRRPGLHVRMR